MSKRRMLLAFSLLACIGLGPCWAKDVQIHWDDDDLFFELPAGKRKVDFEFPFVVKGNGKFKFVNSEVSCGCTLVDLPKKDFTAGDTAVLRGSIDMGERADVFNVNIKLKGQVLGGKNVETFEEVLKVRVHQFQPVVLKPGILIWKRGASPDLKQINLGVRQLGGLSLSIKAYEKEKLAISISEVVPGREYIVDVVPVNTDGNGQGKIEFIARNEKGDVSSFYAHWIIR
jgi:hypothetical protein